MDPQDDDRREAERRRRQGRAVHRWWIRRLVNLFIVFHLCAIVAWSFAAFFSPLGSFAEGVRTYMTTTGFLQAWNMFSPNPDNLDIYMSADITYKSGYVVHCPLPRMTKMGYVQRYREERWRKYFEVGTHDYGRFLWPPLAIWIARNHNNRPGDPPVKVTMIAHGRSIPPPGHKMPPYDTADLDIHYISEAELK